MREDGGGMCEREPLEENGLSSCALGGTVCLWYYWWHLPEVQGLGCVLTTSPRAHATGGQLPSHWPQAAALCL